MKKTIKLNSDVTIKVDLGAVGSSQLTTAHIILKGALIPAGKLFPNTTTVEEVKEWAKKFIKK